LIQDLKGAVDALVAGGAPLPAAGRSLQAKLDRALAALDAGDTAAAIESLQDFVNQVRAFVRTRRLSSAQGQALMDAATAILSLLAS
jgi:hypothetical protein